MIKGLEALEHLNKNIIVAEDIDEDFNTIEKELKEHEQYKTIEQELGIDLITLFKALKCFYAKDMDIYCSHPNPFYLTCGKQGEWYISWIAHDYKISDYGKTWALTREELEK